MTLVNASTGEIVPTLEDLEVVIERGLASFVEVGTALLQIRDERLYRQEYDTFETYCRTRWGFGRDRGEQLISAAEVVASLPTNVGIPRPTNEAQARALKPLRAVPERMAEAMTRAVEATGGKPTAEAIGEAVADLVASTEQKRQDKAELKALMDELNPPDFDPAENSRLVQRRGRFSAICADVANFGDVAGVVADLRSGERPERFLSRATAAHAWLSQFLDTWEATS